MATHNYWQQLPAYYMPPGYVVLQPDLTSTHPLLSWTTNVRSSNFHDARIKNVVNLLRASPMDMSVADLLTHVLREGSDFAIARTKFMTNARQIGSLLNLISDDKRGRKILEAWLHEHDYPVRLTCEDVDKEMESAKEYMVLHTKDLKASDIIDFDFEKEVTDVLHKKAPTLSRILYRAAQSDIQARRNTTKCPDLICSTTFAQLCNSRSKNSIRFQHNFGLFLYAMGTSKAAIEFLSACGLSTGHSTILQAHDFLAESLLEEAAKVASGPHMLAFDNEQISMSQHVTQRDGAEPTVRSFTASIIYSLKNATADACKLAPILERRASAPMITYEDHILPSRQEKSSIVGHLVRDIISILYSHTEHSGFKTQAYTELIRHEAHRPPREHDITEEHILRTVEVDESKTTGCIELARQVYLEQMKMVVSQLDNLAILCVNDQMTCSRLRSALRDRRGDLSTFSRMENFQIGPGFFHVLMNLIWHLNDIHAGNNTIPGSLSFYAKYLNIKRVIKDRPDFYTLRSFFNHVLCANILYAWQVKTGFTDLNLYAASDPRPEDIQKIAGEILHEYASEQGLQSCDASENMLRNTILLNRDLLYFYELDKAISSGDFGRVELLLGTMARMFNGSGGKNYSLELLHLIQNLRVSWPPEFADLMRDNLLISIQGHEDHYMGVDMNIEHNINFQKKHFTSKGVHGTAAHLARFSPGTRLFRILRKKFCRIAKIYSGSTHTVPRTESDILKIQVKIREALLYEVGVDRMDIDADVQLTKDILKLGGETLQRTGMKTFEKIYRAWADNDSSDDNVLADDMEEDRTGKFESMDVDLEVL